MKSPQVVRFLAATCLIFALSACASGQGKTAGSTTLPNGDASQEHPLDARGITACSVLGPEQLATAGMDVGSAVDRSNAIATSCTWMAVDRTGAINLVINVNNSLELIAAPRREMKEFTDFTFRGLPAVREGSQESSICTVYVQIASSQVFVVEASTHSADLSVRPCEMAEQTAGAVIDSLSSRS
jgi:hypothetical protein